MNNNNLLLIKSSHLSFRSKQINQEARKTRYSPHTSAIFAYDHQARRTQADLSKLVTPNNRGVFSIKNCTFEKCPDSKEALQLPKTPSFNIKKIIDKSIKTKAQLQPEKQQQMQLKHHQQLNRLLVKQYWQRFVCSSSPLNDPTQQIVNISKEMGVVVNRIKENKSQLRNRSHSHYRNQYNKKTAFYVNNFKTRYRRLKIDIPPLKKDISLREKPWVEKVAREIYPPVDNEVIPWQKVGNIEQQTFIGF